MLEFNKLSLLVLITLLLVFSTSTFSTSLVTGSSLMECSTMYFFNGIVVYNSTISEDLFLETPTNISLAEGFEQVAEHLVHYNLEFNESLKVFTFRVEAGSFFEGFFISRVKLCGKEFNAVLSHLTIAMYNPRYSNPGSENTVPLEVRENYIKPPHRKVIEVVVPAYEEWFRNKFGVDTKNASLIGLAATAARFIYLEYINYTVGQIPKSIDDVIETRRGDCDDMSRILTELLNYYDIPALIVSGYTYIDGFEYRMPVENVTYVFLNNGPHAFTMAYIPGLGWMSLDFLAGSLIYYPFIVEGYTRETTAPSGEVIEEFFNLHRALNATQVIAVLSEKTVEEKIGFPITFESLHKYFSELISGSYPITTPIETVQVPTCTTPTSTVTQATCTTNQSQSPASCTTLTSFEFTGTESAGKDLFERILGLIIMMFVVGIAVAVYYVLVKKRG